MGAGECIREYLRTRYQGLYQILSLVIRTHYGTGLEEAVLRDRVKILLALKKLYGDEAAELLFKLLEKACLKEN